VQESPPIIGWAVQQSPADSNRRERSWLSRRNLLVLVLLLWNGYFLASLIYELLVQSPSRSSMLAIIVWLWVLGDLAIVLCAWAIRTILKARSRANA
jgi:hypothetical protein